MPSDGSSDKPQERSTTNDKSKRRTTVRVKRKSSSRHVIDTSDDGVNRDTSASEKSPVTLKSSTPIPEFNRRLESVTASRTSLPYPSFSKEHSREAVSSKENLATPPRKNVFTPDPTDLDDKKDYDINDNDKTNGPAPTVHIDAPLSPPLTATEPVLDSRSSPIKTRKSTAGERGGARTSSNASARKGSLLSDIKSQGSSSRKTSTSSAPVSQPKVSIPSRVRTPREVPVPPRHNAAPPVAPSIAGSESTDATPIQEPRNHAILREQIAEKTSGLSSPETGSDISIRTPTPRGTPAPPAYKRYEDDAYPITQPSGTYASPVPPPPPPPPVTNLQGPRVDYLMQHGGLRQKIPKRFINAPDPVMNSSWSIGEITSPADMNARVQTFFAPFRDLLENYTKVINKNGSIAVATGYRSVARRLLDRLEAVFARDISSEICACSMCDTPDNFTLDDERGVSWGEILEYVSGRRDLPQWPPFVLTQESLAAEDFRESLKSPCQTLDVDVPEEYREHYIRQSKKTKESVDNWLSNQAVNTVTAPEEADDDTLTFAILTHLDYRLRQIFKDILGVTSMRPESIHPASQSHTPLNPEKSELVEKSTLAIERLYRLSSRPRAPEVALFFVHNQNLHNVLATLAAISDAEWEILTSGRFDGFLRSGADGMPTMQTTNGLPMRGMMSPSTNSLASAGAPVAIDEETEIGVLAEVEREIFSGMEALEDAFESLHTSAESVRRILRERGAGLAMAAQMRRGPSADILEARLGTPASTRGGDFDADSWLDDNFSEIAPDDSASMISKNRIRRKRRDERRTPGPVETEHTMSTTAPRSSFRRR